MSTYILVLTTVTDKEIGHNMARNLVKERLAACATVSGDSKSFYWWQGKISEEQEHILFIKTRAKLYRKLEKKILETHPYEVPEIIALPLAAGYSEYLQWITEETK